MHCVGAAMQESRRCLTRTDIAHTDLIPLGSKLYRNVPERETCAEVPFSSLALCHCTEQTETRSEAQQSDLDLAPGTRALPPRIWIAPCRDGAIRSDGCESAAVCTHTAHLQQLLLCRSCIPSQFLHPPSCDMSVIVDCSEGPSRCFDALDVTERFSQTSICTHVGITPNYDSSVSTDSSEGC